MRSSALLSFLLTSALAAAEPLVGQSVGSADALVAEGSRLYNKRQYPQAVASLLKATRANPSAVGSYLQLARAYVANKELTRGCYVYRAYLKAALDTPERKKAQAESELCERQLKAAKGQPPDPSLGYVEAKSAFYAAIEAHRPVGPQGAAEALRGLVKAGFVGTELADMAAKLGAEAGEQLTELHRRALSPDRPGAEELRRGRALAEAAGEVGAAPKEFAARVAFLDGLAALSTNDPKAAEGLFAQASRADPSAREYRYFRALALHRGGSAKAALAAMELDLPDDPRTAVLKCSLAVGQTPEAGADELARLLFSRRFAGR